MMTEILSIAVALLGGLNIFQIIFWRSQRDKLRAEADASTTEAHRKEIDLQQDQYDYLLEKLNIFQEQYFDLSKRLQDEMQTHINAINEKCDEIAVLKSKLVYFKGLRCYRSDCSIRKAVADKKEDYDGKE